MDYQEARNILSRVMMPSLQQGGEFDEARKVAMEACEIVNRMKFEKRSLAARGLFSYEERIKYMTICSFLESEDEE